MPGKQVIIRCLDEHFIDPGIEHIEKAAQKEVARTTQGRRPWQIELLNNLMGNVYGALQRGNDLEQVQGNSRIKRPLHE